MFPFSQYTSLARILPTFIVALPIGFLSLVFLLENPIAASVLFGIFTVAGTAIGAQFGGDLGRKAEPGLWRSWGGPPTTRLLRHRRDPGDISIEPWMRQAIEAWLGWSLPTEQEEEDDPGQADAAYREATYLLIGATRDGTVFPLVLSENINYGFKRNLWGMRHIGRMASSVTAVACWVLVVMTAWGRPWPEPWWGIFVDPDFVVAVRIIVSIASTVLTVFWMFRVNPSWIKTSADGYAMRLMETVRVLQRNKASHRRYGSDSSCNR